MKKLTLIFDPKDGTSKIDASGFEDASCLQATSQLNKSLGGKILEEQKKPEAFVEATSETHLKQNG